MLGFYAIPPPPQGITWTARVWFYIIICMCSSLASSIRSRLTNLPLGSLFKNILSYTTEKLFACRFWHCFMAHVRSQSLFFPPQIQQDAALKPQKQLNCLLFLKSVAVWCLLNAVTRYPMRCSWTVIGSSLRVRKTADSIMLLDCKQDNQ